MIKTRNNKFASAFLLSASALVSSPGAHADNPGKTSVLEEVVVTAEHKQASLQETQISLTAFSDMKIKELGISNASDIGAYTPNVTMSPQIGGRNGFAVNIRGVRNGETLVSFDPSVGVYMDGVLIAKNSGGLLDVVDPQRIEVLRGPQGTLYGRNTIGGAINLVTKKPSDEFFGRVGITVGNYNQRDAHAVLNVPLLGTGSAIGALNLRASAATLNRDGFYDNDFAGAEADELQDKNRDVGLVQLQWEPSDRVTARYSYDRTDIDEVPMPVFVTVVDESNQSGADLEPYRAEQGERPDSIGLDGNMFGKSEAEGHALNLSFELYDQLTLTSLSSRRETEIEGGGDADGAPIHRLHTFDSSQLEVFTQEFRLLGSALDARLDFVLGAYYYEEEGEQVNNIKPYAFVSNPPLGPVLLDRTDAAEFEVTAKALYAQATYLITPRWDVTAGIRYTQERRSMVKTRTDDTTLLLAGVNLPRTVTNYPDVDASFNNVSPVLSSSFSWTDRIMTYGKISRGYQSGGFNARDGVPENYAAGFDEEFLTAYELGWKTTLFDQRVRFNGAFFFSDYDDKQVNQFDAENAASFIRNAGVVEIRGLELELSAIVSESVELGVDYGYTDPEYVEYDDGQGNDLSDSNFPYTPKHNTHVYVRYAFPLTSLGLLSARLDWSYRDEVTFLVPSPEANSGDARELWNARVTLSEINGYGDTQMRVSLWGKNLTDEEYWNFGVDVVSALGYAVNGYGEPRTFGLDLELEF